MEVTGCFWMKQRVRKRLRGAEVALHEAWLTESRVYLGRSQRSRRMRRQKVDVAEVYAGQAHITEYVLKAGLRALQPIDRAYGQDLCTQADHDYLQEDSGSMAAVPGGLGGFLYGMVSHPEPQLDSRGAGGTTQHPRLGHQCLNAMVDTILALRELGVHFLIENPLARSSERWNCVWATCAPSTSGTRMISF